MLALAHHGGGAEDDRQHGHIIYDAHDTVEPRRRQVRIECHVNHKRHRLNGRLGRPSGISCDLVRQNLLDITGPDSRLHRSSCIYIGLHRRRSTRQNVACKMRRDIEDEGIGGRIQQPVDILGRHQDAILEERRQTGLGDIARQLRAVLVHDRDRCAVELRLRRLERLRQDDDDEDVDGVVARYNG